MGWLAHLIVDAALAVGLLVAGIHGKGADYLVLDAAGACLLVSVGITAGRGRTRRRAPRLAHRLFDGLLALLLLVSPLIVTAAHAGLDVFATVMAELVAVILARDSIVTREPRQAVSGTGAIEVRAYETAAGGQGAESRDSLARRLGRGAGTSRPDLSAGARRAGRAAGRFARHRQP